MLSAGALLLSAGLCLAPPAGTAAADRSDSLESLWRSARPFGEWIMGVNARQDLWRDVRRRAAVSDELAVRARAAGRLRLLVVAAYSCSDSANSLPYLERLAALAPNLEVRVAEPTAGRWVMDAHRTPDRRAATPTLVVLDEGFRERGCWIERPADLQRWFIGTGQALPIEQFRRDKQAWYDGDAGRSTLREIVEVLEAAAAGRAACAAAP